MPLSEAEKKELEYLDKPGIEFIAPATGVLAYLILNKPNNRKERVVELRTKLRMEELGLDDTKDWQKYYEIRAEEEKEFDKRHGP